MAAKSFKRFQREPSSREPSIWDVYAGQYPQLSAWGAPTYQHWYPYPFTDPNAPQGSTPVSPSEKLGDPGAAAGGAPGGGAGAGGVGAGGSGGVGGAGGVGSPFSGVMPPAVEGTAGGASFFGGGGAGGAEGGVFPNEVGGFDVPSPPGPGRGDIVGIEPAHAGLATALALSAIPTPVGPLGLVAELGKVAAGRGIGGLVAGMTGRTTEQIEDYDEYGNPITVPVAPTDRTLGFPTGYQPVPVTVPQSQIFEGTPALKPVHVAPGAPPENVRGLMDKARASAPSPYSDVGPSSPPPLAPSMFDIFGEGPQAPPDAPQTRGSAPAPAVPSLAPSPSNFGAAPAPTPASVAPTTDPSEAGGIGTVGGGGDGGSSK